MAPWLLLVAAMQDSTMDPAFAEALSEIERDFFRGWDEREDRPSFQSWDELESRIHAKLQPANDEEEWEWAIRIARARATTAH